MTTPNPASELGFWQAAKHPKTLRRALKVAAIVGTLLIIINQGDILLSGSWERFNLLKAMLTYCVPFCVSTYSSAAHAVEAARELTERHPYETARDDPHDPPQPSR